jgi:hypothetical protein
MSSSTDRRQSRVTMIAVITAQSAYANSTNEPLQMTAAQSHNANEEPGAGLVVPKPRARLHLRPEHVAPSFAIHDELRRRICRTGHEVIDGLLGRAAGAALVRSSDKLRHLSSLRASSLGIKSGLAVAVSELLAAQGNGLLNAKPSNVECR